MQVDHINKNTIRVRIDKEELARRGLKVLDLLGDKDKIQQFFYSILAEVDTDHTFTKGVPVTFQVMPNNGGLDLMITKVQPEDANNLRKMMGDSMSDDSDSTQADSDSRRSFFDLDPKDDLNTEVDPLTQEENEANVSAAGNNNEYWKFQLMMVLIALCLLKHLLSSVTFIVTILVDVNCYLIVGLICIFLMTVLSIFLCAYWPFLYLSWKNVYLTYLPIFKLDYLSFYGSVVGVLYVLCI